MFRLHVTAKPRFNTGINESERTIVTSTGKYVITCTYLAGMSDSREFPPLETRQDR
jgi:hypothetical protein